VEGDQAWISFDLAADLRPLWTWNTKQLFVYITVKYESSDYKINEATIWDAIIQTKQSANLNRTNIRCEYPLLDKGYHLRGTPANLTLNYNVMPVAGVLLTETKGQFQFTFPSKYNAK
jgi:signal peptidase complex subunit 3